MGARAPTRSRLAVKDRLRRPLRGGLVLGLEDSGSRMSRIGKAELVHDELLGIGQVMDRIEAVSLEEVEAVAGQVFGRPEILAVVGPA